MQLRRRLLSQPHVPQCGAVKGFGILLLPTAVSFCYHRKELPPLRPLITKPSSRCISTIASSSQSGGYRGPKPTRDLVVDFVSQNDAAVRSLPIFVGGFSLAAVLLNRVFYGIAPVADATSSQSRADILTISLAVTNILAGLVWLSIQPRYVSPVNPLGVQCKRLYSGLPSFAACELLWVWDCLSEVTCCRSLVIVHRNNCLLQIGVAAESSANRGDAVSVDVLKLSQGSLYKNVSRIGKQNYLANLSLYPGRSELPFLPSNTQAVILQPIGDDGIAVIGGDTIRGFTNLDQAWISSLADKLDSTLSRL